LPETYTLPSIILNCSWIQLVGKGQLPVERASLVSMTSHAHEGHVLMDKYMYLKAFLNSTLRISLEDAGTTI
jgi:hypothetical protein